MKLEIKDLSVELNKNLILKDVDLSINEGEFISLLGPSGCGKSTLLKTIAGLIPVSGGTVSLDGEVINEVPAYKRGTVIVFQDMRLFPNMTVAENVAYPLKIKGMNKADRIRKAEEYLGYVQLSGYGDRKISRLSGGQQQRVALARALAAEPKIVLLDEPFSSLDENLREDMRNLVKDLHRQFRMTTILVTHDRQEAVAMADRLAIMFSGSIVQTGAPEDIFSEPAGKDVEDYFGGNLLVKGVVRDGVFTATDGSKLICAIDRPDGDCELMIRTGVLGKRENG